MALVRQPGLWQCLWHYPEDQGTGLLPGGYNLLPLVSGEPGAGGASGTQDRSTFLALGNSASATANTQVKRYPGNNSAQCNIRSGSPE